MSALLILVAMISSAAQAQRRLNSVQSWVTAADLSPGKLGVKQFDISTLEFGITETGAVDKCRVIFADVESLGQLACQLIKERARYMPAYNKAGQSIRSRDQITVEWGTPPAITVAGTVDYCGALPIAEDTWLRTTSVLTQTVRRKGKALFRFRIKANGRVGECIAAALQGDVDDGEYICRRLQANAQFHSPVDQTGRQYETIATMKFSWADPRRRYSR